MNYCSIGKIAGTFGFKGEVVLLHHLGKKTTLKDLETIFIEERKGSMLPWFIESTRIKNEQEIFLKLDGLDDKESAKALLQKLVWLTEDDFHKYADTSAPISFLGFHIINEKDDLGEILEIIEQPHQVLCRIDLEGKEALIPLHEETLLKVDKKKKQVFVKLPDGLLDVFR